MDKTESKELIKNLIKKKMELKNKEIIIVKEKGIKRPAIDKKYVTNENYKELIALYEMIKDKEVIDFLTIEKIIRKNPIKFPYLHKCNESIYDFVNELKCNGPSYIAREMSRQGKEIDYINNYILKK